MNKLKKIRSLFVSLFLGLFLADLSLASDCKIYYHNDLPGKEFETIDFFCRAYANHINIVFKPSKLDFSVDNSRCEINGTIGQSFFFNYVYPSSKSCDNSCSFKKGKKFRDGNFTYELTGKGKGVQVAMAAAFYGKPVGTCDDGCAVSGSYSDLKQINPDQDNEKSWISATNATYTGTSCSVTGDALGLPDTPSETPPDQPQPDPKDGIAPGWSSAPKPNEDGAPVCPKGRCPAQVNGMDICVECDATMSSSSTSKKTESTTTPSKPGDSGSGLGSGSGDGNGSGSGSGDGKSTSSEESQSVTKCQGGVCETTTKTKNKDGKGMKETTTTTKQSQSDYCQKNPQDEANCALKFGEKKKGEGDEKGSCKPGDKRLGCMETGDPRQEGDYQKKDATVTYRPDGLNLPSNGCPAPRTFSVAGMKWEIKMDTLCKAADTARPFVLLLASVASMLIVVAGLKK